ncbi:VUT family protein [Candidatus Saccharibacteria bacterium]|nr:VUT family protein [Candidatus Saccharibacteria bacterium]
MYQIVYKLANPPRLKYFDIIVALFAVTLVVSNISATKIINFGSLGQLSIVTDGGAILFPLTYILGDVLTEVYGYSYARRAIWIGFATMLFSTLVFAIVGALPADASYTDQAAFTAVLGVMPVVVTASLTAFLFGEFMNSFILAKLKIRTAGKKLWLRLIGSTLVGEFFDTLIFCGIIAIGFGMSIEDFVSYALFGWVFKTLVEVVMLPGTYRVVVLLKKREGVDHYDKRTDFFPLSITLTDK